MDLPTLTSRRVRLQPFDDAALAAVAEIIRRPGVREWFGPDPDAVSHEDLRNDGAAFAVATDEGIIGWLAFAESDDPDYHHAGLDIALAPEHQGQGLGPEALRLAIAWLAGTRGHHRFTIDPDATNTRAIAAYAAIGFRPVGILRAYERGADGTFHDGLLMDLLIDEVR